MLSHYIWCQAVDSQMTCQTPDIHNTPSRLNLQSGTIHHRSLDTNNNFLRMLELT
jgi:hypothetical protein